MPDAYESYVEERYQGEVYGEAVFAAWAAACSDPEVAEKVRVLERLERETGEKLADELRSLGRDPQPDPARREEGGKIGQGLGGAPWPDVLGGFRAQLVPLIEAFAEAETLAPDGKRALLEFVTAHERALLAFADGELAGDGDSLAPVRSLLGSLS